MIKVKDGYAKLISTSYKGSGDRVLLSNGGDIGKAVSSTADTLVLRNAKGLIESSVTSTLAPFVISSTKVNTNLNADLLDGFLANDLFQSLTSAVDKNLYIKIGDAEKEVSLLYASYLGGVTKEELFTELTNVNNSTNPNSIKVTIGDTTKYLKVAYSDLAGKVVCSSSTNNVDRPIVVTNKSNGVYYSTKVTLNYNTGNVTAPTFTGALIGNADTATTASKLSTVSKTAWGLTYWTGDGVPTSISGDMSGVGNISISATGNKDYFVNFLYNNTPTYSWRLGYLGSGNANYFVIDSSKSSGGTWHRVLLLGNEDLNATFSGQVIAPNFVSGDGINDFSAGTVKLDVLNIPTSSGGTTFGPGSNGQILKSNGTTVYWASDNNSWRNIQVNGTQIAGTGTNTYALNFISDTGITITGTSGSSSKANSITITNSGVRSVTIGTGDNARKVAVNTNGTTAYLTIPYATESSSTDVLNSKRYDSNDPTPNTTVGTTFLFSYINSTWYNVLTMKSYSDNNYTAALLATPAGNPGADTGYSGDMRWRLGRNSTWLGWKTILDSNNSSVSGGGSTWGSSITVKINGTTKTLTIPANPNTWRGITDSYSGTDSTISLSQKGGNALYNALVNGYASSAGSATRISSLGNKNVADLSSTYGSGLTIAGIYNNGWPFTYGTVINANGNGGVFQIAGEWTGSITSSSDNNYKTEMYLRHRRDSYDIWSTWTRVITDRNYTSYCAPASHSHAYYPLSGNTNMSGDNVWIGSTMGGGTDYWRIGGSGTSDNGVCQITIGDNSNDYFQIVIADYSGTDYTALLVKAGGTYAPHFYESSDQRLKTNIQTILNKDNIPQIKEFDWKESGEHSYGLIAQELEEQGYSELVSVKDDGYKTVNYSAALSLIVGKLQVKILELEKEIEELKNK